MFRRFVGRFAFGGFAALVAAAVFSLASPAVQGQQERGDGDPQVLTRGAIHEAFAEPVTFDAKPGPLAPKQPPPLVDELPPDQKPDGDNVAWIPGYWQWEDDRKDFIWISGFWRVIPPGRKWVPGYWNKNDDSTAQWVGGYWAGADQGQVEYLPAPPATLENGAPTAAPSADHIWTPGTFVWRETRYLWRPGFWVVAQPGWMWTPAYYAWSPCGYVYVDGYWDWSVRRRGVLFAPCYWSAWNYRPRYVYRPTVCIDVDIMTDSMFCRTGYSSYYFGDYYGSTYVSLGFTPWFSFHYARGGGYCPIYAYNSWHYRRANPRWEVELRTGYDYRFRHIDARPPRTYIAQQNININVTKVTNVNVTNIDVNRQKYASRTVAKPISVVAADSAKSKDAPMRFARIDAAQVKQFKQQGAESQQFVAKRSELERQAAKTNVGSPRAGPNGAGERSPRAGAAAGGPKQPVKLDLPKSAVVSRPTDRPASGRDSVRQDGARISSQPPDRPGQSANGGGRPNLPTLGGGNQKPAAPTDGTAGKGPAKLPTPGDGDKGGRPTITRPNSGGDKTPITGGGAGTQGGNADPGGRSGRPNPPTVGGGSAGGGSTRPATGGGNASGGRPPSIGSGGSGGDKQRPPTGGGSGAGSGSGNRPPPSGGRSGSGSGSGSGKPSSGKDKDKPPAS